MGKTIQTHWDIIYETKNPDQVSWIQEVPKTSLVFIDSLRLTNTMKQ